MEIVTPIRIFEFYSLGALNAIEFTPVNTEEECTVVIKEMVVCVV